MNRDVRTRMFENFTYGIYRTTVPVLRMSRKSVVEDVVMSRSASRLELELIQTQMAQKPMLRVEVGMRVRCANKASAE